MLALTFGCVTTVESHKKDSPAFSKPRTVLTSRGVGVCLHSNVVSPTTSFNLIFRPASIFTTHGVFATKYPSGTNDSDLNRPRDRHLRQLQCRQHSFRSRHNNAGLGAAGRNTITTGRYRKCEQWAQSESQCQHRRFEQHRSQLCYPGHINWLQQQSVPVQNRRNYFCRLWPTLRSGGGFWSRSDSVHT